MNSYPHSLDSNRTKRPVTDLCYSRSRGEFSHPFTVYVIFHCSFLYLELKNPTTTAHRSCARVVSHDARRRGCDPPGDVPDPGPGTSPRVWSGRGGGVETRGAGCGDKRIEERRGPLHCRGGARVRGMPPFRRHGVYLGFNLKVSLKVRSS